MPDIPTKVYSVSVTPDTAPSGKLHFKSGPNGNVRYQFGTGQPIVVDSFDGSTTNVSWTVTANNNVYTFTGGQYNGNTNPASIGSGNLSIAPQMGAGVENDNWSATADSEGEAEVQQKPKAYAHAN